MVLAYDHTEKKQKNAHIWERDPLDWFVEPERVTGQLCDVEKFVGKIHDPCCGGGNIVRTLIQRAYQATGSDLVDRAGSPDWFTGIGDFLKDDVGPIDNIVMNPPFFKGKGTEAFIRKALTVARGKVCAFTEARFLFGKGRANGLYREHPPAAVYVITPRPSCPPGAYLKAGNKAEGGTPDFCWLVWDMTKSVQSTQFGWLREGGAK